MTIYPNVPPDNKGSERDMNEFEALRDVIDGCSFAQSLSG